MDTLLAARAALAAATPNIDNYDPGEPPAVSTHLPVIDVKKVSVDINDTQGKTIVLGPRNASLFHVNLLERINLSGAIALWRNPVRTKTKNWGRREMMHVFNGWFGQSTLKEWDKYETFGKCYTAPDPFKNDDPPWIASFCL